MGKNKKCISWMVLAVLLIMAVKPPVFAWQAFPFAETRDIQPLPEEQNTEPDGLPQEEPPEQPPEEETDEEEEPEETEEEEPPDTDGEELEEEDGEDADEPEFHLPDDFDESGEEPPVEDEALGDNEKIIRDYTDFYNAMTDTTTTVLYLDTDIIVSSAIEISAFKQDLAICGYNPYSEAPVIHTLTEQSSNLHGQTMYIRTNAGPKSVLLSDIIINGYNHFGTISVHDDAKNVVITYNNVHYTGPQLTYNRYGKAIYKDSTFFIGRNGGPSAPGELGEVSAVEFQGKVEITQLEAQNNEIFFMEFLKGSIVVAKDADVTIKTAGDSGFLHANYNNDFVVEEGASFYFEGSLRFWEGVALGAVSVGDRAKMTVLLTGVMPYAMIRLTNGNLIVGRDAELYLINTGNSAYPVLTMNGGNAAFNDPKHVVLYSYASRPLAYILPGELNMRAQQINYWNTAGPGDFSHYPLYHWTNGQGGTVTINATVNAVNSGTVTAITTDYEQGESSVPPPDTSNFNLPQAKVISLGRLLLTGEHISSEGGFFIEGITNPLANYYGAYLNEDGEEVMIQPAANASADGAYKIEGVTRTGVTVYANDRYLFQRLPVNVLMGVLKFQKAPESLFFQTAALSTQPILIQRSVTDWAIAVLDTRGQESPWRVTVTVTAPLTAEYEDIPVLHDVLVLVDDQGRKFYLEPGVEALLYSHQPMGQDIEITTIDWRETEGILAYVPPGVAYADVGYSGKLLWILENVP